MAWVPADSRSRAARPSGAGMTLAQAAAGGGASGPGSRIFAFGEFRDDSSALLGDPGPAWSGSRAWRSDDVGVADWRSSTRPTRLAEAAWGCADASEHSRQPRAKLLANAGDDARQAEDGVG